MLLSNAVSPSALKRLSTFSYVLWRNWTTPVGVQIRFRPTHLLDSQQGQYTRLRMLHLHSGNFLVRSGFGLNLSIDAIRFTS